MPAVRAATAADLDLLLDLMREFYAESPYRFPAEDAARSFTELLAHPARGAAWLAADEQGAALGYVVLIWCFSMEYGGLAANIDDLYVRRPARRAGVARALLDHAFAECRMRGCRAVQLEVGAGNSAARALYARYGLRRPDDDRMLLAARLPASQAGSA